MSEPMNKGMDRVLHVAGRLTGALMGMFTEDSDRVLAQKLTESLHKQLTLEWAALLRTHNGSIQDQPQPDGHTVFNYASCRIHFPEVEMLVSEGRGEVYIQIRFDPQAPWQDLSAKLGSQMPLPQADLSSFADAVSRNWGLVIAR